MMLYLSQLPVIETLLAMQDKSDALRLLQCSRSLASHLRTNVPAIAFVLNNDWTKACRHGNLAVVKFLAREVGIDYRHHEWDIPSDLAGLGHLEVLKYLCETCPQVRCRIGALMSASRNGHLQTVQWLYTNRHICSFWDNYEEVMRMTYGRMEDIIWRDVNSDESRENYIVNQIVDNALAGGHFNILQWLHSNKTRFNILQSLHFARKSNRQDMVDWLLSIANSRVKRRFAEGPRKPKRKQKKKK